jgi:hypothetical protein
MEILITLFPRWRLLFDMGLREWLLPSRLRERDLDRDILCGRLGDLERVLERYERPRSRSAPL